MQIHGIVYLLVGFFIGGTSWFINSRAQDDPLLFFFYVGVIFLVIGIAKLVAGYILKPSKEKPSRPNPAEQGFLKTQHKNVQPHQVVHCPRCNSRLHHRFVYCPKCGTKVQA